MIGIYTGTKFALYMETKFALNIEHIQLSAAFKEARIINKTIFMHQI